MMHQLLVTIAATTLEDPLLNPKGEQTITLMVWILIISAATVVGLFNRRLEYAIIFALISTIIGMAFFLI